LELSKSRRYSEAGLQRSPNQMEFLDLKPFALLTENLCVEVISL
jgi:hypothetical protein